MAVETGGCEDDEKMKYTVSRICMLFYVYIVYIVNLYSQAYIRRERERERSFASSSLNVRIYGYDVHRYESVSSVYVCSVRARAFTCKYERVCICVHVYV